MYFTYEALAQEGKSNEFNSTKPLPGPHRGAAENGASVFRVTVCVMNAAPMVGSSIFAVEGTGFFLKRGNPWKPLPTVFGIH